MNVETSITFNMPTSAVIEVNELCIQPTSALGASKMADHSEMAATI
jgi:hypothetical protein